MLPRTGAALRARAREKEREREPEPAPMMMQRPPPAVGMYPGGGAGGLTPAQRGAWMAQQHGGPRINLAATNRRPIRDRNANVLTSKEIEEMIVQREDRGNKFRMIFVAILLAVVGLLLTMKYDVEYNTEVPLLIAPSGMVMEDTPLNRVRIEEERQARAAMAAGEANAAGGAKKGPVGAVTSDELKAQLAALGVSFDEAKQKAAEENEAEKAAAAATPPQTNADGTTATPPPKKELTPEEEEVRRVQMDRWIAMQAAERAYRNEESRLSSEVVVCGRECQNEHKRKEAAYLSISTTVTRDLFDVLGLVDAKEAAKNGGRVQAPTIIDEDKVKKNYDAKKAEIENSGEDPEYKKMALAELKDAYINVVDPELLRYYKMYGRMAPPMMRKVSARDGGSGQEMALRTFKNKLILAWLAHFDSKYADIGVLVVMGCVGFLLPALIQLPKIIDMAKEIERRQDEMDELERRAAAGQ